MRPRIFSMFSGFGGLDMAVEEVTGGKVAYVADVCGDPKSKHWPHRTPCTSPCTILAHRYPDAPNLGDVTAIDYAKVGTIDILCAGFPCQDVSTAGKRAGLKAGTRTGLWSEVVRAIRELNPRLVVLENVPGIFTADADCDVEPCTWCLGDGPDGYSLHALDAVLADLAEIGFDADWACVRASDVGAPHRRERWFLTAYPAGNRWDQGRTESARFVGRSDVAKRGRADVILLPTINVKNNENQQSEGYGPNLGEARRLLPTPTASPYGSNQSDSDGAAVRPSLDTLASSGELRLLPTPTVQDAANTGGPSQFDRNTRPLNTEVLLLPTPSVADTQGGRKARSGERGDELLLNGLAAGQRFGQYADAIVRWESVIGRPAPSPTEPTGKDGAHRLSPRFCEWMMGAPEGWITDVPGITRNEALKACGNGVVRQQAVAALRFLLTQERAA